MSPAANHLAKPFPLLRRRLLLLTATCRVQTERTRRDGGVYIYIYIYVYGRNNPDSPQDGDRESNTNPPEATFSVKRARLPSLHWNWAKEGDEMRLKALETQSKRLFVPCVVQKTSQLIMLTYWSMKASTVFASNNVMQFYINFIN